jgi:molecular chaperone DnaK (HSP70)
MRAGIDFGTTNTVVALSDRGTYPAVSFDGGDTFPSLVAVNRAGGELRYGHAAEACRAHPADWLVLRSLKRLLVDAGPQDEIELAGRPYRLADLLSGFLTALKTDLRRASNAGLAPRERIEAAVTVPANALASQRFMTVDAFRRAGFEVVSVLNEPSAAGFEFAHRFAPRLSGRREHVAVYDLGGGTFDVSLIDMTERTHAVANNAGIPRLGGDDFDAAILERVMAGIGAGPVEDATRQLLLDECRRGKERIEPNTRRFVIDLACLGREALVLPVEEIFAACGPLVDRSVAVLDTLLRGIGTPDGGELTWDGVAAIYSTGGASRFPPIYRTLRERFGTHRVKRSLHPFASTAIGAAIYLDRARGFRLTERLWGDFGVWRESSCGRDVSFDVLFPGGSALDPAEPLTAVRRYRSAHDVGHFRFAECGRVSGGLPVGAILQKGEVFFPFEPALRGEKNLRRLPVRRVDQGREVEERYRCTAAGMVEVTITVVEDGFSRTFRLG